MSASASQKPKSPKTTAGTLRVVQERPDSSSIYFKNKGLFADNYLLNRLPSESSDTFVMQHWQTEELPEFSACYEWMLSTWEELKDILPTLSEAQLEDKWIRPILEKLGWAYEVQDRLKRRGKVQIPDYSLFASSATYKKAKGCKTNEQYFGYVEAIADAKALGVNLDGTGNSNANPSYQIVRYLEDTDRDWGILTDGEYWRIYSRRSKSKYTTFYEVSVRKLLSREGLSPRDDTGFKYFFNLFRRASYADRDAAGKNFLDVVFESGERYASAIETDLKERAFKIVEAIAKGFVGERKIENEAELKKYYDHSLYYLFRLIFVLNCESKGLLDVNDVSDYYPNSLRSIVTRLKAEFERNTQWSKSSRVYDQINTLMRMITDGDTSVGVVGFGPEFLNAGDRDFYSKNSISDAAINQALVELACSYSDDGDLQFVDFARLGADHIGSVFEGLLEYRFRFADRDYLVSAEGDIVEATPVARKAANATKSEVIPKGTCFLVNDSGDRKSSGAYYTPDYIVNYLCKKTISPLCEGRDVEGLLDLKVCDPAMGSGHFLIGAVRMLEEAVLERLYAQDEKTANIDPAEIRWKVLNNCIYGVDLNPLAVELAKISLWMFSARRNAPLGPLANQLKHGDSLIPKSADYPLGFDWKKGFAPNIKQDRGLDVIVGNPPYVRVHKQDTKSKDRLREQYPYLTGDFDIYICFLDLASRILAKGGFYGVILPNKFFSRDYGIQVRDKLAKETTISELVDLGKAKDVFKAATYPALLIGRAVPPKDTSSTELRESGVCAEDFLNADVAGTMRKQKELVGQSWTMGQISAGLKGKLSGLRRLEDAHEYELFCGTPRAKDYYAWAEFLKESKTVPPGSVRYYVCRSIKPLTLEWGPKINSLKKTLEYPIFGIKEAELTSNLGIRFRTKNKILIRGNDYRMTAGIDLHGSVFVGVYGLILKDPKQLYSLTAWMNSSVCNHLFKIDNGSIALSGGYFSINAPHINQIQVPELKIGDEQKFRDVIESKLSWEQKVARIDSIFSVQLGITPDEMKNIYKELGAKYEGIAEAFTELAAVRPKKGVA